MMIRTIMMRSQVALVGCSLLLVAIVSLTSEAAPQQVAQQQQQQQQQQQLASGNQVSSTTLKPSSTSSPSAQTATTAAAAAASSMSSAPSLVNLRPAGNGVVAASSVASDEANQMDSALDAFDGKNPFADDSLWQMPVHLVRDLSNYKQQQQQQRPAADKMVKSASNLNHDDDDDDDSQADEPLSGSPMQMRASGAPTVISATTDLKTAAGYHYPTHGHHSGYGHHEPAHHYGAAGHHGDHYGGKYFQYASVPYPYAWDFGYRRGNPYHTIERYEHGKGPHFQTKVKWSDKHGGYGVHVWDYNHDDHHSHHYGGHHEPSYGHHEPAHHYGASGHHGYGHH